MRRLFAHRPGHPTIVAYLALLVALGGGAFAAVGGVGRGGTINACYAQAPGALRVVKRPRCGHGARLIVWNQTGPVGPPGASGLVGPRGAGGLVGPTGAKGPQGDVGPASARLRVTSPRTAST